MPRFCTSFELNTSMLRGTVCRFSSRLRAVTTTSCSAPLVLASAAAAASSAPARCAAVPARAAATATPILEPVRRGSLSAPAQHCALGMGLAAMMDLPADLYVDISPDHPLSP